jgi:ActR/RegA family two-component response regulator
MSAPEPRGLMLSDDLIFTSRVTAAARSVGATVVQARSVEQLRESVRKQTPTCVLLDLEHAGLSVTDLLAELRQVCAPMPRVIAYGSHVDAVGLKAARSAGCDLVLPRSAFVEQVRTDLAEWLAPRE